MECIVSEPCTGFHIAFKMLDVDGNEQVDKKEFLKVCCLLSGMNIKHCGRLGYNDSLRWMSGWLWFCVLSCIF